MSDDCEPSPKERAERYLALAEAADEKAFSATGTICESYRRLAEQWRTLARFAEEFGKEEMGLDTSVFPARSTGYSRRRHL